MPSELHHPHRTCVHHFDGAACQAECHGPDGTLARPVDELVDFADDKLRLVGRHGGAQGAGQALRAIGNGKKAPKERPVDAKGTVPSRAVRERLCGALPAGIQFNTANRMVCGGRGASGKGGEGQ